MDSLTSSFPSCDDPSVQSSNGAEFWKGGTFLVALGCHVAGIVFLVRDHRPIIIRYRSYNYRRRIVTAVIRRAIGTLVRVWLENCSM